MLSSSSSPPIAEGACRPAPLSTSVNPVALFNSVAAYKGNNDPSSFPWASSAPSSLVAPLLVDCCVARLLPLSSSSTPAASLRLDLVAPSLVDCRITPSSVDCRVAPLSVDCRVTRLLPLLSPSITSASSCHDVAPSSDDCRVAPLSVDWSNRRHRQHLSLLPGDRSEGRDMQQRSLDCLRRCNGGWRQPWLAVVAAGGAAMASSAGGDKKRGQLRSVSVFVTHEHHGGKSYANFADAAASHPACVMPQRRDKY